MNKGQWKEQRKELMKHLYTAQRNRRTAEAQIEELELTIEAYNEKIQTFK